MFSFKKIIAVAAFAFFAWTGTAGAQTTAELQAQIAAMLEQIRALQSQMGSNQSNNQSQEQKFCYNFDRNIKMGDSGAAVTALQTALGKEGFDVNKEEKANKQFSESTASAVSGFQQKYASEILAPNGLKYGNGFVGASTRKKLNSLYQCEGPTACSMEAKQCSDGSYVSRVAPSCEFASCPTEPAKTTKDSSLQLIYPTGGDSFKRGAYDKFTWKYSGETNFISSNPVQISLVSNTATYLVSKNAGFNPAAASQSTSWRVGYDYSGVQIPDGKYGIKICVTASSQANSASCESGLYSLSIYTSEASTLPTRPSEGTSYSPSSSAYWAYQHIEGIYRAGIAGGCSTNPSKFCPDKPITRAEIAVFIIKGMGLAPDNTLPPVFADVPATHWAYGYIQQMSKKGITAGCGSGNYCPDGYLSRAQAVTLVLLAMGESADSSGNQIFADTPASTFGYGFIQKAYRIGITAGCTLGSLNFCPSANTTRAEAAVFISSGFNIPKFNNPSATFVDVPGENAQTQTITVTSPNGGEVWKVGETRNITWNSTGITSGNGRIDIYADGQVYVINPSVSISTGSHTWMLTSGIPVGSNYKIKITYGGVVIDTSNEVFSISAQSTATVTPPAGCNLAGNAQSIADWNLIAPFLASNNVLNPTTSEISCFNGRITIISLISKGLTGPIPTLPSGLQDLQLASNSLTGPIPTLPSGLTNLQLSNNSLTGPIPTLPSRMGYLDLASNSLTGPIPTLPSSLAVLYLSNNSLTGTIPAFPSSLAVLQLSNNSLTGPIPTLPSGLAALRLSNNSLTGPIPTLPSSLTTLNLSQNQLTGTIPTLPSSLTFLDLSSNSLTGTIPTLLSSVTVLNLNNNQLTGTIPTLPSSLTYLNLSQNQLTGTIPAFPSSLTDLYLSNNSLSGTIPAFPSSLKYSGLSQNQLTGTIPTLPSSLAQLNLINNKLCPPYPEKPAGVYSWGILPQNTSGCPTSAIPSNSSQTASILDSMKATLQKMLLMLQ